MGCTSGKSKSPGGPNDKAGASNQQGKDNSKGPAAKQHSSFVVQNPGKIHDHYTMEKKKLGEGSYGSVSKAVSKSTNASFAVKSISKSQMKNIDRFRKEIDIMMKMDHPNILKLYETFEDTRFIYLVLELCLGGELFERIISDKKFTEKKAATVMLHLFRALNYMHNQSVTHRDLKPENFLFVSKEPVDKSALKVIDFGLATYYAAGEPLKTKAGTPYYVAPQVLSGRYDEKADVWSLGVIMYVLLCGYPPFYGDTDADVLAKVRLGNYTFHQRDWKSVTENAKDLVKNLLKMDPKERFSAQLALNHVWVRDTAPDSSGAPLDQEAFERMAKFRDHNKLKKTALKMLVDQGGLPQIESLTEMFVGMDTDGDGSLSPQEVIMGCHQAKVDMSDDELSKLIACMETDGQGRIHYRDFLAACLDASQVKDEHYMTTFRRFDVDGDGKITKAEFAKVMEQVGEKHGLDEIQQFVTAGDKDGDGEIDFEEFKAAMKATNY